MYMFPQISKPATSVKDFGASPSATAAQNDASIAAAIATLSSPGTLFFPPGTYQISASIIINLSYITVYAFPGSVTLNVNGDPTWAMIFGNLGVNVVQCSLVGITFQQGAIGADRTKTGGGILWHAHDSAITDVRVNQFGGKGIYVIAAAGSITDTRFTNIYLVQNGLNSTTPDDNLVLDISTSDGHFTNVICAGPPAKNFSRHGFNVSGSIQRFINCHAYYHSGDGFHAAQNGASANGEVIGGEWETNTTNAIYINQANWLIDNAIFYGNTVRDILVDPNGTPCVIRGCSFTSGGAVQSIGMFGFAGYIADCIFNNATGDDIRIGANSCTVHDCNCAAPLGNSLVTTNTLGDFHDNNFINNVAEQTGANNNTFTNNQFSSVPTIVGTGTALRNNRGFNPRGHAVTQPAVPASTVAVTNTTGCDCTVYISGGTLTLVSVGGSSVGITAAAPAGSVHAVRVLVGQTVAITYSVAPTWQWFGD